MTTTRTNSATPRTGPPRPRRQEQLGELREERTLIFQQSPIPMLLVERSGVVQEANGAACRLLGLSPRDLQGLDVEKLIVGGIDVGGAEREPLPGKPERIPIGLRCRGGRTVAGRLLRYTIKGSLPPRDLLILTDFESPQGLGRAQSDPAGITVARTGIDETGFPEIIGRSPQIRRVCRLIGKVAAGRSTILIHGESGTGKELFARAIHYHSPRSKCPFVRVNCAGLTETLLGSELFGHVKGAFTGAIRDRKGRFQEAEGGTLLLDEIGAMSLAGQSTLLRVLQEGELEPVGSSRTRQVDVRIIATTNVDLRCAAKTGEFRKDLFYRLSVIDIELPPLRDRAEDIPLLAMVFARRFARQMGKRISGFEPEAIDVLLAYSWPGNVRELENAIERAVVLEEGEFIRANNLAIGRPLGFREFNLERQRSPQGLSLRDRLTLIERQIVVQTLRNKNWVKKDAAAALGIDPRNLSYFLNKHDIREPESKRE